MSTVSPVAKFALKPLPTRLFHSVAGMEYDSLQTGHKRRAKRCALKPSRLLASRYGGIPKSFKRGIALKASFVCKVEKTK